MNPAPDTNPGKPQKPEATEPVPHRRRQRYSGKYPRRFEEKYKEHNPDRHADTVAKVMASGKTPAGTHRPIMVREILEVLAPKPGDIAVDCTLGYGGHAQEILRLIQPAGKLLGLDADPIELPKTEERLRQAGYTPETFIAMRTNFAGLPQALARAGLNGADCILADLGVSSMQLDNPARGFSFKQDGPLDLRMNPAKGVSASDWLRKAELAKLTQLLEEYADEPHAKVLGEVLHGKTILTTLELRRAVSEALPRWPREEQELSVRRVFQALRIAVNDELGALDLLLRHLPGCLNPGGRVAILTFHSGEDRRVKRAFENGSHAGIYEAIAAEPLRPDESEKRDNPRSAAAKLRWARKFGPS